MEAFLGLPQAAAAHAAEIDNLMGLLHGLILILFVGWSAYFIYVLVRFRAGRNPKADYMGARTHASSYMEGGVALAEAVLLIGFSMPLWADRVSEFPDEHESVNVRVVAEQFAWNVHYAGADGVFGKVAPELMDAQTNPLGLDRSDPAAQDDVATLNQLYLPVDKPAIIHLSSKDVIHSFGIPEMRVKQDAIPGLTIPVWFTPTVTTARMKEIQNDPEFTYEIACAQLCGIGHYRMRGFLTVYEQEEYDAWIAEQSSQSQAQGQDDFWN
ncbi:MAG: cytochrome c oxidase subunit II [Acidobacteriota bacterium]